MLLESLPKISIVTISYNQGKYLEETIQSVLSQNYPNLEYIIIDGGSTDNSVEIIKKYEGQLSYWESAKDKGQYYAVEKGLNMCTGDIMAWINSDDKYLPNSFQTVADVFTQLPQVNWLMGIPGEFNEKGSSINRIALPWARWSKYRYLTNDFQYIQQESSFWRRHVWEMAGSKMDHNIKYAGDMELWTRFFRREKLYTVLSNLAGFRHRNENQVSKTFGNEYLGECRSLVKRERKLLNTSERAYVFWLQLLRFPWSIFFFLDIPIFSKVYSQFFKIPTPIAFDLNKSNYRLVNYYIKYPPVLIGNWIIQRKPKRIKAYEPKGN
jgi:glycosyltransferase involved in cell wall biosynthesis